MMIESPSDYSATTNRALNWIAKERRWTQEQQQQHTVEVASAIAGWFEDEVMAMGRTRVKQIGRSHFYYGCSKAQLSKAGRCMARAALVHDMHAKQRKMWEQMPTFLTEGFEQEQYNYIETSIQSWEMRAYNEAWPDIEAIGIGYCSHVLSHAASAEYRRLVSGGSGANVSSGQSGAKAGMNKGSMTAALVSRDEQTIASIGSIMIRTMKRSINKLPLNCDSIPQAIVEVKALLDLVDEELDLAAAQASLRQATCMTMAKVYRRAKRGEDQTGADQHQTTSTANRNHQFDYTSSWAKLASVIFQAAIVLRDGMPEDRRRKKIEKTWLEMA